MYVISSKGIPADVTGGDDVATRKYSLCPRCVRMSMRSLHSRRALFEEGALTSAPRGSGPTLAEAERAPEIVAITGGSDRKIGDGMSFSPSSPARSSAQSVGSEARSVTVSSAPRESTALVSSSSGRRRVTRASSETRLWV